MTFGRRAVLVLALLALFVFVSWMPWRASQSEDRDTLQAVSAPALNDATAPHDSWRATLPGASATSPVAPGAPGVTRSPGILPRRAASPRLSNADAGANAAVVTLVNAARRKAGCAAVHTDVRLDTAARGHSVDMVRRGYFAHNTPEGATPWDRARAAGYPQPTGENIAMGYPDAEAVMNGWMDSPGHRRNILNCASHAIGVGLARDRAGTVYWTQMFGAV